MNIRRKKDCTCLNCSKIFYPYRGRTGKYCSNKCQQEYQSRNKYKHYLQNQDSYYGKDISWIKKYLLEEQNYRCSICGIENTWNNKTLVLILDHIDGHSNNNRKTNLRLVCPNCDSQLDTYKSKNKNSDRIYYHLHHR